MIGIGKKYHLKKIRDWFDNDSREYRVVGFCENDIVVCLAPDGESYIFKKDFLIDPDKQDEIYSGIRIIKG